MSCALCGDDAPVNEAGYCEACAAQLAAMSGTRDAGGFGSLDIDNIKLPTADKGETSENGVAGGAEAPPSRTGWSLLAEFGSSSQFALKNPFSVATEADGNISVMDRPTRHRYRVSVFATDGSYMHTILDCEAGSEADQLKYPKGIASDTHGNIFIPDAGNDRIQRFDASGRSLGAIGESGDSAGQFNYPCDIDVDNTGMLYVADTYNCRIQTLTPQGLPLQIIGANENSGGADSGPQLSDPAAVTVDDDGNVYVADTNHHRLVKYAPDGRQLMAFGAEGSDPGCFSYPGDVRVTDDGLIYVADKNNTRVQKFSPEGSFLADFSLEGVTSEGSSGGDIAIDADDTLVICNATRNTVMKVQFFPAESPLSGEHS